MSRSHVLDQVESCLPESSCTPITCMLHLINLVCRVQHGGKVGHHWIWRRTPRLSLNPALFSVAIHTGLNQNDHPLARVLAYLDVIFISSQAGAVIKAGLSGKSSLSPSGLSICNRNWMLFSPILLVFINCCQKEDEIGKGMMVLGGNQFILADDAMKQCHMVRNHLRLAKKASTQPWHGISQRECPYLLQECTNWNRFGMPLFWKKSRGAGGWLEAIPNEESLTL